MAALLAFISMPGPMEMLIILGVGVLLFGSRLPEVGRSLGKSIMEFKKGMQGIEGQIHGIADSSSSSTSSSNRTAYQDIDDREEATAPKFDPPAPEPSPESGET